MPTFHEPCSSLHQNKEQPDIELFFRILLLLYIYATCWSNGGKEENCGWEVGGRGGEKSVLINRENSFPYFIYVVAIISI